MSRSYTIFALASAAIAAQINIEFARDLEVVRRPRVPIELYRFTPPPPAIAMRDQPRQRRDRTSSASDGVVRAPPQSRGGSGGTRDRVDGTDRSATPLTCGARTACE